jgi:hypothetical protein
MVSIQSSKESSNYNKIVCIAGVIDTGDAPEKLNISANIRKKIEIFTRLVFWGQEKLFEEKTRGEKSVGTVPLSTKC